MIQSTNPPSPYFPPPTAKELHDNYHKEEEKEATNDTDIIQRFKQRMKYVLVLYILTILHITMGVVVQIQSTKTFIGIVVALLISATLITLLRAIVLFFTSLITGKVK